MEASPSRRDSFSRSWLDCKAPPTSSMERLDADACLGCSFNSSTSFIDMDPAELFSMRWTSSARPATEQEEEAAEFDFGQLTHAGAAQCSSPLLVGAGLPLLPCESRNSIASYADAAFYSAQSSPASAVGSRRVGGAKAPLLATRRILLRHLWLLAPLCWKMRALPARALASQSSTSSRAAAFGAATTASPARQSTSSYASAAEYWCQGHAETAVRDAILYCKKSVQAHDV